MLERNSFDRNCNGFFENLFNDIEMYIYITVITLDKHGTKFGIIIIFKLNDKHRKVLNIYFKRGLFVC